MREHHIEFRSNPLILSNEDRDAFLHALENPPKPNERLKKALEAHHRILEKNKC